MNVNDQPVRKEAAEKASDSAKMYTHIAHALARGYTDLFYVNLLTDEYIELHTDDDSGVLTPARRGTDFFESCAREAMLFIHPEDQDSFVKAMNRKFLEQTLSGSKVFELIYRRRKDDRSFYVQMKISRMEDDPRFIVVAVSDIDELMQKRREEEKIQEERIVYDRLHALVGNFIVIYVVDPQTEEYHEFSATEAYEKGFRQAKTGTGFFEKVRKEAHTYNHPKDLNFFLSAFTKENMLKEIEQNGSFTLGYRLLMDGAPLHVLMKAALVQEKEGLRLIIGLYDIDVQVRQEEEFGKKLLQAQSQANIDGLTGVKNKHAYLEAEAHMDLQIAEHHQIPFAIVMLDINDLKQINDTAGHQAGDQYIRNACRIICDIFKHSPVYRIGGDEFAVIATGGDYSHIEELIGKVRDNNESASISGGVVIACGMAKYDHDLSVASVFERADQNMYENKNLLKLGRS